MTLIYSYSLRQQLLRQDTLPHIYLLFVELDVGIFFCKSASELLQEALTATGRAGTMSVAGIFVAPFAGKTPFLAAQL